ncbi:hypothetical protein GX586_00245, partial [bacterium]|nr:hypothetical protein [bacterium]
MNAPRATVVAATFFSFLLFSVALHAAPPSNDNFASRINLAGPSGIATGTTLDATYETGEPEHDPYGCGENSVWWKWTAPSSGTFTFDLAGSTTTVVLAVYTGSALAGLQRVGYTSHYPSGEPGWLQFNATAGTTYQIAVAGQSHFGGGTVILRRYPDSLSGWFTGYVATGMNNAVSCGIDGSMVVMQVHEIYSLVHRTNRYGYILTDATGVQAISNIVVRDKRDRVIATADALPGNSRRYIHDVNKHGVLMTDIAASSLLVYAVRKGTLELVAERVFPTWFSAFFEGKDILVSLEDHSTGVCSLQVFDRKLEKVKWEVPPGTGFFNWARSRGFMGSIPNYRNGTVYRITEIGDTLS